MISKTRPAMFGLRTLTRFVSYWRTTCTIAYMCTERRPSMLELLSSWCMLGRTVVQQQSTRSAAVEVSRSPWSKRAYENNMQQYQVLYLVSAAGYQVHGMYQCRYDVAYLVTSRLEVSRSCVRRAKGCLWMGLRSVSFELKRAV